jgi:hypothetical protein
MACARGRQRPHRGGGAPHRARRHRLRGAGAHRRGAARRAGHAATARAAAPAAQPGGRARGDEGLRRRAAGGVLRHGLSCGAARGQPPLRVAARCTTRACGATAFTAFPTNRSSRSSPALRPSWRQARDRRAPGQRRVDVRHGAGPLGGHDHDLFAARRPDDGHALRRIDAAVVLYLLRSRGMSADEVEKLLFRESGLLGLSGVSSDMRALAASAAARSRRGHRAFRGAGGAAHGQPRGRRCAAWTPSCSPAASARTTRRCASACSKTANGSA